MILYFLIALLCIALSGVIHGLRDAYAFKRDIFELAFGVKPLSFWGSESWLRKYQEWNPTLPERKWYTPISDFWHLSHPFEKSFMIIGLTMLIYKIDLFTGYTSSDTLLLFIFGGLAYLINSFCSGVAYKIIR